jgi:hypothetical protein
MDEKKVHKGYRLSKETLKQMDAISAWYGDIDQTQVLTMAVAELWHRQAGAVQKRTKRTTKKEPA